jgi:nitroreductase
LIVTDPKINKRIDKVASRVLKFFERAYAGQNLWRKILITILSAINASGWDQRPIPAIEKLKMTDNNITFDAPVVIHVLKDKRGIANPDIDATIAAHNIVLAAHAIELGTCYIGFIANMVPYAKKIKKILNIEYPYDLVTSICVGYPKPEYNKPVFRGPVPVEWIE